MNTNAASRESRQVSSLVVFAYSGLLLMCFASPIYPSSGSILGQPWHLTGPAGAGLLIWLPFVWLLTWSLVHRGMMISQPRMLTFAYANLVVCVVWIGVLAYIGHSTGVDLGAWLLVTIGVISGAASLAGILRRDKVWSYYLSYYPPVFLAAGVLCAGGVNIGNVLVAAGFAGVLCWDVVTAGGSRNAQSQERSEPRQGWVWICRAWFAFGLIAGVSLAGLFALNTVLPLGSPSEAQPNWAIIVMNTDAFLRGEYLIAIVGLCCIPLVWSGICMRRMKS